MNIEIVESLENGKILLRIEKALYHIEAVFSAAYKFTGSCFVNIFSINQQYYGVNFSAKNPDVDVASQSEAFYNELIDQELRYSLDQSTRPIKELIIKQAFFPFQENERS